MQNGLLVLQEAHAVNGSYENGYDDYGTCQVIDLSTGERLPVPDGAYRCIVCGDRLVFTCYARPADLAEDAWDDEPPAQLGHYTDEGRYTDLRRRCHYCPEPFLCTGRSERLGRVGHLPRQRRTNGRNAL